MTPAVRDRLIQRCAKAILWRETNQYQRDSALRAATAAIDSLIDASAEGKAVERALRVIEATEETREEQTA